MPKGAFVSLLGCGTFQTLQALLKVQILYKAICRGMLALSQ